MKTKLTFNQRAALLLLLLSTLNPQFSAFAQGTAFTYQGRLTDGANSANGNYGMTFALYPSSSGGIVTAGPLTNSSVTVSNGLFTVTLDFGVSAFTGPVRWLEIGVSTNGGGVFTTLAPRQQVTPAPFAIYAESGSASQLSGNIRTSNLGGSYNNALTFTNAGNNFGGNGSGLSNVNAASLGGVSASSFWNTSGNAGTAGGGGNFVGTTDNQTLYFKVNGMRALMLVPSGDSAADSNTNDDFAPSVIGGCPLNQLGVGVVGGTIGGGGALNFDGVSLVNFVLGDYGTVGGGMGNWASNIFSVVNGGRQNRASGQYATIGGGYKNAASGPGAFIGGGGFDGVTSLGNTASGTAATVSGGIANISSMDYATVGGGDGNTASGIISTVGGGQANMSIANFTTVAGGYNNTASGPGAFVGGGGNDGLTFTGNTASGAASTVSGGLGNSAGNTEATVGGGDDNHATGSGSTVGGGAGNHASNSATTVAGGLVNTASGNESTVGGGSGNAAGGFSATIPGGESCAATGDWSFAAGRRAKANHQGSFIWCDSLDQDGASAGSNTFNVRASGGVLMFSSAGSTGVVLGAGSGSWSSVSDRNVKENFQPVDSRDVLSRVAAMPLTSWNYKTQDKTIRHIGPMAQDFYAAFNVGEDEKHITGVDADGVALAAIQGLNQKLEEKDARMAAMEKELSEIKQTLAKLTNQKD